MRGFRFRELLCMSGLFVANGCCLLRIGAMRVFGRWRGTSFSVWE